MEPEGTSTPPADRRSQLVAAAHHVVVRHGWTGATVKRIAEQAGVSEATIYRYFRSKEDLFDEAVLAPLERAGRAVVRLGWQMPASSPEERHRAGRQINAQFLAAVVEMTPLLHAALSRDRRTASKFYITRLRPLLHQITEAGARVMIGWAEAGDAPLAALVMQGTYYWVGLDAMLGGGTVDPRAQGRQFGDFLLRAVERPSASAGPIDGPPPDVSLLSDELWACLEPELDRTHRAHGRDHRDILEALAWRYTTGCAWRSIPARFGPWQTAWKRARRWATDGTWDRLYAAATRHPLPHDDLAWLRSARAGSVANAH